jgi:RNA recognition motif-containing protein
MNGQEPQENPNKLFVGNLPWSVTQDQLSEMFAQYGELVDVHLVTDRMSGRSRGIGFVEFASAEEAQAAIEAVHGTELEGRELVVNVARPRQPRNNFRGGNRGGYNRGGNRGGYGRRDSYGDHN